MLKKFTSPYRFAPAVISTRGRTGKVRFLRFLPNLM